MSPNNYPDTYASWQADPVGFWEKAARDLPWFSESRSPFESTSDGTGNWFVDGEINACFACIDHHVQLGRGAQTAIQYESPITGTTEAISYTQLQRRVAQVAGGLVGQGISKGDRVIVYMPMIPMAVITMLACARIGAIHSVVFGGFSAKELATRIDDCEPAIIVTASCGYEPRGRIEYMPIVREAFELASHKPDQILVFQRTDFEVSLNDAYETDLTIASEAAAPAGCVPVASDHPLYILYTSGTTGAPKGVVRDTGGHLVTLKWSMKNVYNCNPGDVYWAASDIGWVVGHSYIVYGPLLQGATSILFEGKPVGTPNAGVFWSVIEKNQVNTLFTAPTAIRAIRGADPDGSLIQQADLSSLKSLFLAGERADPPTIEWISNQLNIPVVDHWWQTELGWPALASCVGLSDLDTKPGSAGKPVPGFEFNVFDACAHSVNTGDNGEIAISLPLPPGCLSTIWRGSDRFRTSYLDTFPGYYLTGDEGYRDEDGFYFVMGRTDDVINVAGHRLSTGSIEEVVAANPHVNECAVVGVTDELKGQLPVGFVVLDDAGSARFNEVNSDLVNAVRKSIGPVAAFKSVISLPSLPKTRSGKILRNVLRKIYQGDAYDIPATIDDANVLPAIEKSMFKTNPKNSVFKQAGEL